ncbi:hypothetical protein P9112_005729 [Eukaryota sp. TZLM1-RC]
MAFYLMITNGNLNENFSKPRRRCSKCRKSGHNIATCPLIQKEKLNARAATADLNFSLSHNPENEYLSEIPDNTSNKEDQKDGKKCVFCRKLVAVNDSGRPLLFCGTNFGGVDFHKSSYLCKAAFIGGGKNFIYEFVNRFPEKIHLIENCGSSYLISLQQEIETLSPNIWAKCFPSDIVELPSRSLLSLPLTFAKLQKKILKVLENLDYIEKLNARAATADLNFSLSHNPENEYLSEIPDNTSNKEDQKDGKKCVFCRKLVAVNDSGRPLLFCGTNFGGVDFHKSSYLCKAAFIGGGKNFIYEFVNRFPEKIHLIENCGSSYLISLQQEIETLSPNIWAKCFPSDIVELPLRSLLSLPLTFAKLQKKILKVLENLDYIVRLSLAKEKNPVFANFFIDLEDSCSSCLISQIPNIYGLLLNDHQWKFK